MVHIQFILCVVIWNRDTSLLFFIIWKFFAFILNIILKFSNVNTYLILINIIKFILRTFGRRWNHSLILILMIIMNEIFIVDVSAVNLLINLLHRANWLIHLICLKRFILKTTSYWNPCIWFKINIVLISVEYRWFLLRSLIIF